MSLATYVVVSPRGTKVSGALWVYRGSDGKVVGSTGRFSDLTVLPLTGPKYARGDTIGCGVDFAERVIFFTKNGELLGRLSFSSFVVLSLPSKDKSHEGGDTYGVSLTSPFTG
jgi:hypothetical protein